MRARASSTGAERAERFGSAGLRQPQLEDRFFQIDDARS